jgi:signal transduction histidine kinase
MTLGTCPPVTQDKPIEQQLVYLRWTLIVSLAYMILIGSSGLVTRPAALIYVGLLLASNLLIPRLPYRNPRTFGSVLLALDTMFVLVGVLLSDANSQDLLIGYFLCILMATFGDSERRIAGAGFLVAGVYSLWVFRNWDVHSPSLLIRLPFLFITTFFYGFMMERVRSEHARRLQADERIRTLDCLLQVTRSFSSSLVSQQVLERAANIIKTTLGAARCSIELVCADGSQTISAVAAEALDKQSPIWSPDPATGDSSSTVLALPIYYDVEPLGVLLVEAERPGSAFGSEEIELCQVIANAAAPALKNARQYESLAEIECAKAEFLSNLSHELRTPLNAILGFSEIAAADAAHVGDAELIDSIERVSRNARGMTKQIESLLALSQATLGRDRKRVARVDLSNLLRRVIEQAERLPKQGPIEFGVEIAPDAAEVYTDGDKLERVVDSIVLNAIKFTPRGSVRITAALVKSGNDASATFPTRLQPWERLLSLSVEDTGIGIGGADLRKIFQDFHQGVSGLDRPYGGLGIGLALARRLTATLGGVIQVESRPDSGSLFQVLVPVQTPAG